MAIDFGIERTRDAEDKDYELELALREDAAVRVEIGETVPAFGGAFTPERARAQAAQRAAEDERDAAAARDADTAAAYRRSAARWRERAGVGG